MSVLESPSYANGAGSPALTALPRRPTVDQCLRYFQTHYGVPVEEVEALRGAVCQAALTTFDDCVGQKNISYAAARAFASPTWVR